MRLTRRILEASRILQIHLLDHVIIGAPAPGRSSYFSSRKAVSFHDYQSSLFRLLHDSNSERWNEFELPKSSLGELQALCKFLG